MIGHCMLDGQPPDLPDAGQGACCYGAAVYGPQRCTCWTPVYDLEQQEIQPGLPLPRVPVRMCHDCAFRPGSPERSGDESYAHASQDDLDAMVAGRTPFACHQGIRHPVKWVHPSGVEVAGHPGGYDPPIVDGIPYKADGTPADLCSGWLLRCAKESPVPAGGAA